jgi:protein phosphatase
MTAMAPIETIAAAATDPGVRRSHNEDSHVCAAPLYLVADGMGGYESGELASAAALSAFATLEGRPSVSIDEVRAAYAVAGANVVAVGSGGRESAGTTLSGVAISENGGDGYWLIINVGDSRTYLFRGGVLEQVSVDHSVVQEMVDAGEISAVDATSHARRNVVTRALGAGGISEPDFWMLPAEVGDRILVCSDGLSGELSDGDLVAVLQQALRPAETATTLVASAVERGARDNVTVIIVDALRVAGARDVDEDTIPRTPEVVA